MTRDDVVCDCRQVSAARVSRAIEDGARTVDDITRATGAGAGCGQCRRDLRHALRRRWWRRLLFWGG